MAHQFDLDHFIPLTFRQLLADVTDEEGGVGGYR